MEPRALHDRRWASRGVQVVRPGGEEVEARGPRLYLLLGEHDLALFSLREPMRRMNWLRPRLLRLRLVDSEPRSYEERLLADADGRLIGVRRSYRRKTRATLRAGLTGDSSLARAWRAGRGGPGGWRALRGKVDARRTAVCAVSSHLYDARMERDVDRCLERLLEAWREPGASLNGVYEFQPGVWLHESVEVSSGARLYGPLWVGAGARVTEDQALVGPLIVDDQPGAGAAPGPMAWEEVHPPGWGVAPRLRGRAFRISKRIFDVVFSAAVLLMTLPLYVPIAIAIMLEDGRPVFFAHRRQTLRGREFPCYKFRTMLKNADRMKAELQALNRCDGPQFFIENDPRVLRVGRTLRRFQLDELPQFWNVLLGHMSVVGPRPSPDSENQFCPAWREARLSVRPGVTGLWQVRRTREPETDFQEWIRYDLEYVQHQSWRLDMWIILRTIQKVFTG